MKNTIKKCLSVLLACLMIMSVATVAFADGGTLTVGTGSGKAGEDVDISVTLNADGVTNGVFKISYNKDVLTYKSATMQQGLESAEAGLTTAGEGTISVSFANKETAVAAGTALITVTFTIKEGAKAGERAGRTGFLGEGSEDLRGCRPHFSADLYFGRSLDPSEKYIGTGKTDRKAVLSGY